MDNRKQYNKKYTLYKIADIMNNEFPFKVEDRNGQIYTVECEDYRDCECGDANCGEGDHDQTLGYQTDDGWVDAEDMFYFIAELPEWF